MFSERAEHSTTSHGGVAMLMEGVLIPPNPAIIRVQEQPHELSPKGWTLTFADEFHDFSWYDGTKGRWKTTRPFPAQFPFGTKEYARTDPKQGELQLYMDPQYKGSATATLGVNPFRIQNNCLIIEANVTAPTVKPYVNNYPFTSGYISSEK